MEKKEGIIFFGGLLFLAVLHHLLLVAYWKMHITLASQASYYGPYNSQVS